jgi:hypothetical protein
VRNRIAESHGIADIADIPPQPRSTQNLLRRNGGTEEIRLK